MNDKEKELVLKALECCSAKDADLCNDCPYVTGPKSCFEELAIDVLRLIKDEAKWVYETDRTRHWHCSNCGDVWGITAMKMNYCPNCGKKMDLTEVTQFIEKWEKKDGQRKCRKYIA